MDYLARMKSKQAFNSNYFDLPSQLQEPAQQLCWRLNQTDPSDTKTRQALVKQLFGTATDLTGVDPNFHCDYGFNIHAHGFAAINYNCSFLDTSPIEIGNGAFIAPNVCLACSGHSLIGEERRNG